MRRMLALIAAGGLLTLGGCNKKSENPPPSAGTPSGAAPATGSGSGAPGTMAGSATGSAAAGSAAGSGSAAGTGSAAGSAASIDVATPEDFENEASTKITDKNVEAQVQALEKQLEQK